jgi:hypothetical protein
MTSEEASETPRSVGRRLVLLGDPGPEAEALARELRELGLRVVTSAIEALPERAARLVPMGVVLGIDDALVDGVLERLRSARSGTRLALLGARARALELGAGSASGERHFCRPADARALAAFLEGLESPEPRHEPERVAASARDAEDEPPDLLASFPVLEGLPEIERLIADLESGTERETMLRASPEIEALLHAGEHVAEGEPLSEPAADAIVAAPVPAEMLAAVDELLADGELPLAGRAAPSEAPLAAAPGSSVGPRDAARASAPSPVRRIRLSEAPGEPARKTASGRPVRSEAPPEERPSSVPPASDAPPPSGATTGVEEMTTSVRFAQSLSQPPVSEAGPPTVPFDPAAASGWPIASSARRSTAERLRSLASGGPLPLGAEPSPAASVMAEEAPPPSSEVMTAGDGLDLVASVVAGRASGALLLRAGAEPGRVRWVVVREGDLVTVASEVASESLCGFLVERGDLDADVVAAVAPRLPHGGRHAAAALIAQGFLGQDELWPVLRAHAEWILTRTLRDRPTAGRLDRLPPERLRAEPAVFGGATGVEVFVETVRRVLSPEQAIERLGGRAARLAAGRRAHLLGEAALGDEEALAIRGAAGGASLAELGGDLAPICAALVALGVLVARAPRHPSPAPPAAVVFDANDAEAVRKRVAARLALVREGDYFSLLGVARDATAYEIRRAFVALRRAFEPARVVTGATVDLADDVALIVEVLEEAHDVLRDPVRRDRYRKAIEATASRD